MRLAAGSKVGPYEVLTLLGAGGMAEVYRARDGRIGRDVAIKVMSEALSADGPLLERFEREAKLAGSLNHPNVVSLYDVGLQDGKPYFVTELLQGDSLRERLAKGPIPVALALDWAAQISHGLAAAHERGIVHRDLKPENVFITREGTVKVIDFGIAKLLEAALEATPHGLMDETLTPAGGHTGTGMVLGTPGYMSPEQVRGDKVDARTDFFSLGAVLYEMLSSRRAFPANSVVESGYAIIHNDPEPLPDAVPAAVVQVVQRCLEKDPARRFHSARDLAFHLDLLRSPTGAVTPSTARSARTEIRRRSSWWHWPLVATLAAVSVSFAAYFVGRDSRPPLPSVDMATFRWGRVSAGRFNHDGRVVFSAAWNGQPLEVFTRPAGSNDAQPLGLHNAALLAVSGTGELAVLLRPRLVDAVERGTLAVASAAGGTAREVAEDVEYADWSSKGELAVVRVIGGKRQLEYPLGTPLFETAGWIVNPRVSPRGDAVAFLHAEPAVPQQALVVDRHGQVRSLASLSPLGGGTGLAWTPSGEQVWVSTTDALWANRLSGAWKLVYQGVYEMRLEDIAPNGAVLVNAQDSRRDLTFVPPDGRAQRQLSWSDRTFLAGLSDDGGQVLFSRFSNGSFTFIEPTDGSPPLKLGPGFALALSHDGKTALSRPDDDKESLSLLSVGPGAPKTLPLPGLDLAAARWLQGDKGIVFAGRAMQEKQFRLYRVAVEGGLPKRVSDTVISPPYLELSKDDRFVATRDLEDVVTLFPLDGGPPVPLPELGKDAVPAGWTMTGQLWVRSLDVPSRMRRYEVRSRRILEERTLTPSDPTGVWRIPQVHMTPDGRAVAFDYERSLGYLYVLEGLAPPRW
ncbi:MAG: protein kinase domain-containing protein [Myxococcaceae bacterium]